MAVDDLANQVSRSSAAVGLASLPRISQAHERFTLDMQNLFNYYY